MNFFSPFYTFVWFLTLSFAGDFENLLACAKMRGQQESWNNNDLIVLFLTQLNRHKNESHGEEEAKFTKYMTAILSVQKRKGNVLFVR